MSGISFLSTPTVCGTTHTQDTISQPYQCIILFEVQTNTAYEEARCSFYLELVRIHPNPLGSFLYLSKLHELSDLGDPGQEPLIDLQGLLAVALLHLKVFLYRNNSCCEEEHLLNGYMVKGSHLSINC